MQIIFEGDTALSLVQQMQQYITDTGSIIVPASVGTIQSVPPVAASHEYIAPVPNVVINHSNPDFVKGVVEQPEVPGQPDASGLDKSGFPWDARIHSGGKSMNADGTWRYKKGADKAVIQSVEAELSNRLNGAGIPMPVVVAAPPAPAPVAAPPASSFPSPCESPAAVALFAAAPATPATIVNLISTLKLDVPTVVLPILNNFGLNTLPELFQPQAVPMLGAIYAALGGH